MLLNFSLFYRYFTQTRPYSKIGWIDAKNPRTGESTVIMEGLSINPEGVAFDWVHKKIYWTDSRNRSIYAMNEDGSQVMYRPL